MVTGLASLLLVAATLPGGRVLAAAGPSNALYLDLDPQPGGYTIHLPDGEPWHRFSTSDSSTIEVHSILDAGGAAHGFVVSDGAWSVSYWQDEGPLAPGTVQVPQPVEEISCGPICAAVAAGPGNNCFGAGTFTIEAIELQQDGTFDSLDADFDLRCFDAIMAGSIRYHAARPVAAMLQTADALAFGLADVGEPTETQTVTFTSVGDAANELGEVTVGGDDPDSYEVTTDTCSGATLDTGETCAVEVRLVPAVRGYHFATLTVSDGTAAGSRRVRLVGAAQQHSTLTLAPGSIPAFGTAPGTVDVTVAPPGGTPVLFVDGVQQFGPTSKLHAMPDREVWTYGVTFAPGHHTMTSELYAGDFHAAAHADPLEVNVGTKTSLTLSTATDDGIANGEAATLRARLDAGAAIDGGTLRIIDAATGDVLAQGTVSGTTSTLDHVIADVSGAHGYRAEYEPEDPAIQPSDAEYELTAVPGPRPETAMPGTPLWSSSGAVALDGFSSPDPDVTFECRVDVSDWFACEAPVIVHAQPETEHVLSVRAVRPNGLGDRTPASRPWLIESTPPTATAPATRVVTGRGTATAIAPVRVSWSGADAASGVDHYAVSLSTDGGAWSPLGDAAGTSRTAALRTGHAYRFRIRAVDRAGNVSGYHAGPRVTLAAVQDGSSRLRYRGSWTSRTASAWGATLRSSSTIGSSVSLTFTGRSVSWVGSVGPTAGKAQVWINGALKAVVDLRSSVATGRTVVWAANYQRSATRTVTIKVVKGPGVNRVDVDGFVIGR